MPVTDPHMSAGRDTKTPIPSVSRTGIHLPWQAVAALVVVAGSVATAYIFATKGEVVETKEQLDAKIVTQGERVTRIEETEKHHDAAITDLKDDVKDVKSKMGAVETNVRTMLQEVGVPAGRIARPKAEP